MEIMALPAYVGALAAVTIAPGPMVAVIVTRSLGRDTAGAAAFAAGVCMGDLIAIAAIAVGIGAWMEGQGALLATLRVAGVLYLLWLALRMWRDRQALAAGTVPAEGRLAAILAGVALCLGNPATFLVYLALLPSLAPDGFAGPGVLAPVMLVSLVVVGSALGGVILLAGHLGRMLARPDAPTHLGRPMAVLLVAASLALLAG